MIYIVRHGQTNYNKDGIIQGHYDIPLNEQGINEAKILRDKLRGIKFDKVYSSPLKRAYQTGNIITSNEIIIDERLIERYNGLYDGKYKDGIFNNINFSDDDECNEYNIELENNLKNRLISFIKEINLQNNNENILIVTHAGVIINIRVIIEKVTKSNNYKNLKLGNCDYITYSNDELSL